MIKTNLIQVPVTLVQHIEHDCLDQNILQSKKPNMGQSSIFHHIYLIIYQQPLQTFIFLADCFVYVFKKRAENCLFVLYFILLVCSNGGRLTACNRLHQVK